MKSEQDHCNRDLEYHRPRACFGCRFSCRVKSHKILVLVYAREQYIRSSKLFKEAQLITAWSSMGHLSEVWPRHSQTCHRPTRKSLGHNLSQRRAGANIEEEAWHQYRHSSHMFVGCFCSAFHVSGTSADSVVRLLGCKQYPDHGPDLFCAPLVRSLTHCCSMIQRREILSCSALKH